MIKSLNVFNVIMGKIERFQAAAFVKSLDFGYLVFIEPEIFKFIGIG